MKDEHPQVDSETHQELKFTFAKAFKNHPDAAAFVIKYNEYVSLIDDLVDKDVECNAKSILQLCHIARELFTNPFYRKWYHAIEPVDLLANMAYDTSTQWEKSDKEWKVGHADVLRHQGLNVFFIVLTILMGREEVQRLAPLMMEYTHTNHLNDLMSWGAY